MKQWSAVWAEWILSQQLSSAVGKARDWTSNLLFQSPVYWAKQAWLPQARSNQLFLAQLFLEKIQGIAVAMASSALSLS